MEEKIMYVVQRADGKFYWKHPAFDNVDGYDSFDKAYLFSIKRSAQFIVDYGNEEQECKVKRVKLTLID